MSNALLNEETLQMDSPIEEPKGLRARRDRLPSSEEFITIRGVARVTRLLFALLLIGGFIGWAITEVSPINVSLPGWYIPAVLAGLVLCFASYLKPSFARILAPIYAVVEGLLLGSITKLYEYSFDAMALQHSHCKSNRKNAPVYLRCNFCHHGGLPIPDLDAPCWSQFPSPIPS